MLVIYRPHTVCEWHFDAATKPVWASCGSCDKGEPATIWGGQPVSTVQAVAPSSLWPAGAPSITQSTQPECQTGPDGELYSNNPLKTTGNSALQLLWVAGFFPFSPKPKRWSRCSCCCRNTLHTPISPTTHHSPISHPPPIPISHIPQFILHLRSSIQSTRRSLVGYTERPPSLCPGVYLRCYRSWS